MNTPSNPHTYTIESEEISFAALTRAGYTFCGWFSDELFSAPVNGIAAGSYGEVEVYAKWTYYTLSTQTNIAKAGTYTQKSEVKTTANTEATLTASTNAGYTWLGWFEGDEKVSEGDNLT